MANRPVKKTMEIEISPENRALMLGAAASGMLGNTAFQKVLKLDVGNLRVLSTWIGILADIKEQIKTEQEGKTDETNDQSN